MNNLVFAGIVAEAIVDQVQVLANQANGVGAHAGDIPTIRHDDEDLQQRAGCVSEHVRRRGLDVVVANAEAFVDGNHAGPLAGPQNGFVEVLQQNVVDFTQRDDVPVVVMHEALDAELGAGVGKAQALGETALIFELQVIFLAFGQQMQAEAHPPEKTPAILQPHTLLGGEHAELLQVAQVGGAEFARHYPDGGLQVAQPAGEVFRFGSRPYSTLSYWRWRSSCSSRLALKNASAGHRRGEVRTLSSRCSRSCEPTSRRRSNIAVATVMSRGSFALAVFQRADAVAEFLIQVDEAVQKLGDDFLLPAGAACENQQIDVGMGKQLAAAVAAHGEHGDVVAGTRRVCALPDFGMSSSNKAQRSATSASTSALCQ
jgi:hypothetical protein